MIKIMIFSFILKDPKFFLAYLNIIFIKVNLKLHKKIILSIRSMLYKYSFFFLKILKNKGFMLEIKGKIGVTGSAKKRKQKILIGSNSLSKNNIKCSFYKMPI
jgi:hypothetical protein